MGTKQLFTVGIVFSIVLPFLSAATEEGDTRREQLRQEAAASYVQISQALNALFTKVNFNQRPTQAEVDAAVALLEENKRYAVAYDTPQKAGYMLLQAWTAYYQNEHVNALNWAVRACREDMTNGDAWITQTLFSYIYGRRPIEPQVPRSQREETETRESRQNREPRQAREPRRTRPQPQPRARQTETQMMTPPEPMFDASNPYGRPGVLRFDIKTLKKDFYRERFIRQEYQTTDRKKVVYTPGQDILCVLFWQGEEIIDPNAPGAKPVPAQAAQMERENFFAEPMMQMHSLEDQQAYFEVMIEVLADKKEVKFVEMNTNTAVGYEKALKSHTPTGPLVAAASPQSGAAPFTQLDASTPFMAIIDKEGQVKYAGPANGFAPAFVLTHLTGAAIDLEVYQSGHPGTIPSGMMPVMMPEMMLRDPRILPAPIMPADPNKPQTIDPNHPRSRPQVQPVKQLRELSLEDQVDAEKKLAYARDLYMKGSRMGVQSYKRGVELCREIIRKYPNTKYAEEARQLLRQVPERQRATYKITEEELGL